jgi:uncharacterized membrane protein YecN with MAPEG domain
MLDIPVTLATASILGVLYVVLSLAVSLERNRSKVGLGTGAEASVVLGTEHQATPLIVAVRRHGNFQEYVPISILLLLLLELSGADRDWLYGLAGALILSRLMIAFGMGRAAPNPFRAGGITINWVMIMAASIYGLVLVVGRLNA